MANVKRLLSFALAVCIAVSLLTVSVFAASEFKDIKYHWAKDVIIYMADNGIVNGFNDYEFRPDAEITRGQVSKILSTFFDLTPIRESIGFKDVPGNYWAYKYIMDCARAGIVEGDTNGNFNPKSSITRQAAAAMIARVIAKENGDILYHYSDSYLDFKDGGQIAKVFAGEISYMKDKGYTAGYRDGSFKPLQKITRAEFCKMLFNVVMGGDPIVAGHTYKLNISISDNAGNVCSSSAEYLTNESNFMETIMPLVIENRDNFKAKFPSVDMKNILDNAITLYESGEKAGWNDDTLNAWYEFVDEHFDKVAGDETLFYEFAVIDAQLGELACKREYKIMTTDTAEGREGVTYTVTVDIEKTA